MSTFRSQTNTLFELVTSLFLQEMLFFVETLLIPLSKVIVSFQKTLFS